MNIKGLFSISTKKVLVSFAIIALPLILGHFAEGCLEVKPPVCRSWYDYLYFHRTFQIVLAWVVISACGYVCSVFVVFGYRVLRAKQTTSKQEKEELKK